MRAAMLVRYSALATLLALLVWLAGTFLAPQSAHLGVVIGAAIGLLLQLVLFWALIAWRFADRPWLGYMLGMLGRFAVFAAVAFLLIPRFDLPLGATLFSLAGVFWLTTLIEPLHFPISVRATQTT